MTNQEQEKLLGTESLAEYTLNYIQYLVSNKCEKEVKIVVKKYIKSINYLLNQISQDKFKYLIFIASYILKQDIKNATLSMEFEKKYLLKIKEILKKDKDYNNLGLIFSLIYSLNIMKNIRNKRIENLLKEIYYSTKGIEFIPNIQVSQNTDELEKVIEEGIKSIQKQKV